MVSSGDDDAQTPPSDQPPGGADQGEEPQQWADIVARLGEIDAGTDILPIRVVRPAQSRAGSANVDYTGRDWDGTEQIDAAEREVDQAEHFIPPEPDPVLGGSPLLTMAWFAVAGMPVLWLVLAIVWTTVPAAITQGSVAVFIAGLAVLLWRMPHRRDPHDTDDGAVV